MHLRASDFNFRFLEHFENAAVARINRYNFHSSPTITKTKIYIIANFTAPITNIY